MTLQARHTPTLSGKKVIRALSIDGALLPHVSDAITTLTEKWGWEEVSDPVEDVLIECQEAVDSWYSPMQIGQISYFLGDLPDGWLALDGSTYDQEDYPELFDALDGQFTNETLDTFTLPDLRDLFPVVAGDGYSLGDLGGDAFVTLTEDEIPVHSHTYTPPVPNIDLEAPGAPDIVAAGVGSTTNTGNTGAGDSHENRPPFFALAAGIFCGRV